MAYEDLLMPWERGSEVMAFKRNKMLGDRFPWRLPFVTYYWDAREGVTASGERVSAWVDRKAGVSLAQGTGANQPILLPYSGTNYLWLPGVDGNYASAPDSAALSITGDIDIRINAASLDWTPSAFQMALCKSGTGASIRSYMLGLQASGALTLFWEQSDGTQISKSSTVATGITDNTNTYFRATLDVDNGSNGNDVAFYKSTDYNPDTRVGTWTQIGTTVTTAGTTNIRDSNSTLAIGANNEVATPIQPWSGKIYRVQILNGISGTLAFDANFSSVSEGATSFTESANGATVTINSTGSKPAQIVGSQQILFDGAAHYLATGALTLNQPQTAILVLKQVTFTNTDRILHGANANSLGLIQNGVSPTIAAYAGSSALDNGGLSIGSYGVLSAVYNGAGSSIQVNLGTPVTGDAGANNAGGVVLGANDAGAQFSNIQIKALALCNTALSTAQLRQLINAINFQNRVF